MPLPGPGEAKRAILDTYTKEHSAEYQARRSIDLPAACGTRIGDLDQIESIVLHTSHHTHYVIGTGSNDPQKFDPDASRETLDHSVMYIFAVALQDGTWHHERLVRARARAAPRHGRAVAQDLHRRGPGVDPPLPLHRPREKAFGGRVPRSR